MQVGDIMSKEVKTCTIDHTFADAAKVLHDNRISSVIIVQKDGSVAGIVTERDLVNIVADGLDPKETMLADRMTRDLATVERRTDISEASRAMADRRIRHLPVIERGKLLGIISIRDLWKWALEELTAGHELPDLQRSHTALSAAVEVNETT
ncbi:MAG: CBS domain-containing protein [Actinomycetota bacterium]